MGRVCAICGSPRFGREWCAAHYYRWKKHGDPLHGGDVVGPRPRNLTSEADVFDWFMPGKPPAAPSAHEGCWDWNAGTRNGVGVFSLNGKTVAADEAAYRRYRGAIPEGMQVIQTCGRRICVQPAHLRAGIRARRSVSTYISTAILTEDDVRWIRRQTTMTHRAMAEQLGVSRDTVTAVRNRKRWEHVS